jgi:hypothetical protein
MAAWSGQFRKPGLARSADLPELSRVSPSSLERSRLQVASDRADPVGAADVLIVTPYNAQISEIQSALADSGQSGFRVGTVDKFRSREGAVVSYSMARARAIIVASLDLIRGVVPDTASRWCWPTRCAGRGSRAANGRAFLRLPAGASSRADRQVNLVGDVMQVVDDHDDA